MSETVTTTRARIDTRAPRFSLIWAIPLLTALIAAWLAWDTFSKRGPTITITFEGAEGLQAGQSHVRHRDVDLGLVTSIALSDDLSHAIVTAEMNRKAAPFLTDQARFWVVKPRFFAGNISGLNTLISGSYIEMLPAGAGAKDARKFTGLENPPLLAADVPGRTFLLHGNRLGSLNVGAPVFYRDLNVGEILGWDLGDMAKDVTVHAFVRAPFDGYVHEESRFWDASGVSVKLGADGVQVQLESLKALLLGGVAFDTPDAALKSPISTDRQIFTLYADREAADNAAFRRKVAFLGYFPGSVSGLGQGSPVTFHGLRVGHVSSVGLQYDPKSDSIRAPVGFEVEPERISDIHLAAGRGPLANTKLLVQRGLRAQLQSVSLLTGQMSVALDFFPNAPPAEVFTEGDVIVVPTAAGQFADLGRSVNELLAKLDKLPFEKIGKQLSDVLAATDAITNDPSIKQSLQSLATLTATTQQLVSRLDTDTAPALRRLPELTTSLQEMMARTNKLIASTDVAYGANSSFHRDTDRMMVQLTDMIQSVRVLADLLSRHPEALVRGRTDRGTE